MADLDLARLRRDRHRKVVDALDAQGLAAAVLLGQAAVAYAVGARAPAADAARAAYERSIALVTADGDAPHLYTSFAEGVPPELPAGHVHAALSVEWRDGAAELAEALPDGRSRSTSTRCPCTPRWKGVRSSTRPRCSGPARS